MTKISRSTVYSSKQKLLDHNRVDFSLFISDVGISPYPQYTLNKEKSMYKSHRYDEKLGKHIFTVQHGCRFFLKLDFSDYPREYLTYEVLLGAEEDTMLRGVSRNGFKYDVDMVDIQIVTKQHENSYTLLCKNNHIAVMEAKFRFKLIVEGIKNL